MKNKIIFLTTLIVVLLNFHSFTFAENKIEIATVEGTSITAKDPQIVKNLQESFTNIQRWILALSTPAAIIGIGTGVFMKKFSFGDEERIIMGRKLIRNSLFSYAFIVASGLILQAVRLLIGATK